MAKDKKPVGKAQSQIEAKAKHPGGRPTLFSQELADRICEEIMKSEMGLFGLSEKFDWFPAPSSVYLWLTLYPKFSESYRACREAQQDRMAESIIKIADDSSGDSIETSKGIIENREFTSRSKLRVETRMWLMERLSPKKYGKLIEPDQSEKELTPPPSIHVHIGNDVVKKAEGL
jgi:hypothetical protein